MKKWTFLAFYIVNSFSSFFFAASKSVASENNNSPSQISEYYRNYNFVNLFSSELERELITDSLMCKGIFGKPNNRHLNTSFEFCDQIPKLLESERLKRISTLITELNKDIISDTSDKMVIQGYIPGVNFHMRRSNPQIMPLLPNSYSLSPKLFKINQLRLSDNILV